MASRFWRSFSPLEAADRFLAVTDEIGDGAAAFVAPGFEAEPLDREAAGLGVDALVAERARHPARDRHAVGPDTEDDEDDGARRPAAEDRFGIIAPGQRRADEARAGLAEAGAATAVARPRPAAPRARAAAASP